MARMKYLPTIALVLLITSVFALQVPGKTGRRTELKVGDTAPTFVGVNDKNEKWESKKHAGKKIYVVYFYPADMTPGCTKQACNYRDALADLERDDIEVIGVSGDSAENHQVFRREYDLNFTLLADFDGKIAKAFGVPAGKGDKFESLIAGKSTTLERGATASRWTFVIDRDWKIVHKDTKVKFSEDTAKVLAIIKKIPAAKGPTKEAASALP